MTKFYTLLCFALSLLAGCKSASKAYQKGNYVDAIERGVKKLQKEPADWETKELVQNSYKFAVSEREDRIRIHSNSNNESKYERIYEEYVGLQRLYNIVHEYPAVAHMISTKDYSNDISTYQNKIADMHIEKAQAWEREDTKPAYKNAYNEYNYALRFRNDMDLRRMRDYAYEAALTRVLISPIQSMGGYQYATNYRIENFQREVLRTLSYSMTDNFVKFYTEFEARTGDIQPDQILELNLTRISIGQPFEQKNSREVSKQVVIKETVYKADSVVKEWATVKARIITSKRSLLSQGDLFLTLRDPQGRIVWNDRFTGEYSWQCDYYSYTGDERALTDNDKSQLNQRTNPPPSEDQIMLELFQAIQHDLSYRVRRYYGM